MAMTDEPAWWFDYTRESLVPLWVWAIDQFGVRGLTEEERKQYRETTPEWLRKVRAEPRELTSLTKTLIVDIGFYLADVYRRKHPQIDWALWTKKAGPCNQPFLNGFKIPLVPKDLVSGCAWTGH